ncbi:MAG TPA: APC family permease [Gemmatimonadetes bacterium]|nr:APC family permease [Gemmatimonadota bacterium]
MDESDRKTRLLREIGLTGLVATGVCSMMGASINVVPIMIQRSVPGIGSSVVEAYLFSIIPASLAALSYAILSSAMPRAGGSYVYASRALSPYLGFVASFSQWFGLSIAIGVISYLIVPFFRDICLVLGWLELASTLDAGPVRLFLSLLILWSFVALNLKGVRIYEKTLVPLMLIMFALGSVVIVSGFLFDHQDFISAVFQESGYVIPDPEISRLGISDYLAASAILFTSFIGFDSIAQAGGEARNPARNLPLAIGMAVAIVGIFDMLFTAAIYHAVPWSYIAEKAQSQDLTAPGLLGYLLPDGLTVAIILGAAVALLNDLPAMLLSVSRLMFSWAEDGIIPSGIAKIDKGSGVPRVATMLSGCMASIGIVGSYLASDFFLGIDILVTSMLVNFIFMCLAVLVLPKRNREIANEVTVLNSWAARKAVALFGIVLLTLFLAVHVWKDLNNDLIAWYFHSTFVWLLVMGIATLIYFYEVSRLKNKGISINEVVSNLPSE